MNEFAFEFAGHDLRARPSGTLFWPQERLLCVSDLHLGKSTRAARRSGEQLPPYDIEDTLARLQSEIHALQPETVLCLGDSFDDPQVLDDFPDRARRQIRGLRTGRRWIWIEGNHDPGPHSLPGLHLAHFERDNLVFRHIASTDEAYEISGHYHPKKRLGGIGRPCFLLDHQRLILPAFGTYTGGLRADNPVFSRLMSPDAKALVTGRQVLAVPLFATKSDHDRLVTR